ncbi:MAG: glycosyltransferase family 4 protein [Bacteroidota bacterium]
MKKIVLVTNIPTPYRVPLFNLLANVLEQEGFRLHVVFGASTYGRRMHTSDPSLFRFEHTFLDSNKVTRGDKEKTTFLYNGLSSLLGRLAPDAVIVSGFSPATVRVYLRRITKGTPYIIWNGSIIDDFRRDGMLKSALRKRLIAGASGFIAYGTRAKEYLVSMGAPPDQVSIGINTVDTDFFSQETARLRSQLPPESVHRLLSIGYLSPRKGTMRLIELMRTLKDRKNEFILDLVGDGEERGVLEDLVKSYGLENRVRFHGFVPRERLPEHMAKAKVFLFQTRFDIWGLVLNEAMAAGLPVICSHNAGAARDLIEEGKTGYVRDFDDAEAVASLVEKLIADPQVADKVATQASAFITENAGLKASAEGFLIAIQRLF